MKKSFYKLFTLALLNFLIVNFTLKIDNCSAQWVQRFYQGPVCALAKSGNNIFAGLYGVYLSTNNGYTWTQTSLNNQVVNSIAISGNNIFAGTWHNGIYLSTNNGYTWTQTSLNNQIVRSLAISGNNIFAGTQGNGVYLSTNNGYTWTQTSLNNQIVCALAISGNNIFAGAYGVYRSTNNGYSWIQTTLNDKFVTSFAISGNNIFAGTWHNGTQGGVFLSTNNGTSWSLILNKWIWSLAVSGNNIFAGTDLEGFYLSTNNGINWTQRNEGWFPPFISSVKSLILLNSYILAGTYGPNGIWRRPLSQLVNLKSISAILPKNYTLSQNYPNPFNPTTNIKFDIQKTSVTKMIIYDALGREVATLVNEVLKAGSYEVEWNASGYPSGVYFYKLHAGDFKETKKMLLLK